jgi:hypothetical protein
MSLINVNKIPILPFEPYHDKEEFASANGTYVKLGNHKNKIANTESFKETFLTHNNNSKLNDNTIQIVQESNFDKGLKQTKFHKGFERRNKEQISNPIADQHNEFTRQYLEKSAKLSDARSKKLQSIDHTTGYNIITGSLRGAGPNLRPEGIRKVDDYGLGPEASTRGKVILRDSKSRFFSPLQSGTTADYRQAVLNKEGLKIDKTSSILQLGKKDLPSYGVEDQFSKSNYAPKSQYASTGLVETLVPGKFTPSNQAKNPSGKTEIVKIWNTNVDINNKTMNCLY